MEKKKSFLLLKCYCMMPFHKDLCKEVAWLDLNANECKQGLNMGSSNLSMFGWRKNVYNFNFFVYGRYVSLYFGIDLCSIKF